MEVATTFRYLACFLLLGVAPSRLAQEAKIRVRVRNQELIVRLSRLGLEPATSAVTVPSGTLHITNLHVDSEFVVVAEVDDVVAAATGASGTS